MNRCAIPAGLALLFASVVCPQEPSNPAPKDSSNASSPAANSLNLPTGTAILAKMISGLDTAQCKAGDMVEAQITHDVKDGSKTLLKKGAHILGQVYKAQAAPDAGGLYGVWINFDKIAVQPGEPSATPLDIQAIAPPASAGADNLSGVDTGALMAGHRSAKEGFVDELTVKSTGAIGLPGVDLAFQNAKSVHLAMLVSKKGNFRLAKGSQIVFRVFGS